MPRPSKRRKIAGINSKQLPGPEDVHARRESGLVDLKPLNIVRGKKGSPAVAHFSEMFRPNPFLPRESRHTKTHPMFEML